MLREISELIPTMKSLKTPQQQNGVQESEDAATIENASEEAPAVNVSDPSMPIFDAKKPDYDKYTKVAVTRRKSP